MKKSYGVIALTAVMGAFLMLSVHAEALTPAFKLNTQVCVNLEWTNYNGKEVGVALNLTFPTNNNGGQSSVGGYAWVFQNGPNGQNYASVVTGHVQEDNGKYSFQLEGGKGYTGAPHVAGLITEFTLPNLKHNAEGHISDLEIFPMGSNRRVTVPTKRPARVANCTN